MRAIHSILGLGATIAALSQCAQPADNVTDGNATPIIELRLASDTPRAGWARAELDGQPLYIAPSAVVSDDDIESVEPHLRPTQIVLDLQLRPEAYGRLHTATSQALGERIAVILNSEPLEAPRIRSPGPVTDGRMQIAVNLTGAEAERIANQVRNRWPPQ